MREHGEEAGKVQKLPGPPVTLGLEERRADVGLEHAAHGALYRVYDAQGLPTGELEGVREDGRHL